MFSPIIDMFVAESLICQFVSWPFVVPSCTWQQWVPAVAGYLAAFTLRINSVSRLVTFVGGVSVFYLTAVFSAILAPLQPSEGQANWFLLACLFLVPTALVVSLVGLICGDLVRILRKRLGGNRA